MAAIRSKNTKPEVLVRNYLWRRGFRYRLNNPRLPGHPDIVLRKYRTCIFVNGCFTRFTFPQASTVNNYLLAYPNRKMGANALILFSRPFITEQGYEKSKPEINNVANDFGWYEQIEQARIAEEERQKAAEEQRKRQEEQARERDRQQKVEQQIVPKRTTTVQDCPRRCFHR